LTEIEKHIPMSLAFMASFTASLTAYLLAVVPSPAKEYIVVMTLMILAIYIWWV